MCNDQVYFAFFVLYVCNVMGVAGSNKCECKCAKRNGEVR